MELKLIGNEKALIEIPTEKFRERIKETLNVKKALFELSKVIKNETKYDETELKYIIFSNASWTPLLDRLREPNEDENLNDIETLTFPLRYTKEKIIFKMCPIIYKDKIEYKNKARSELFNRMVLKEEKRDGEDLILLDSVITDPEYIIDNWLCNSLWPYTKFKWKEVII